jgi:hypothetical protein
MFEIITDDYDDEVAAVKQSFRRSLAFDCYRLQAGRRLHQPAVHRRPARRGRSSIPGRPGMKTIPLKLVKGGKEADLLAPKGWIKQTTIGEPRLSEIVVNYRQLGYEVHVIEHREESAGRLQYLLYGWRGDGPGLRRRVYPQGERRQDDAADDELFGPTGEYDGGAG